METRLVKNSFKVAVALLFGTMILASCGKNSSSYKKLEHQYDSLMVVHEQTNKDMEEMLSLIDEVESNFESIREAENYISIKQKNGELTASARDKFKTNMKLITETLQKNKAYITDLEEQLNKNKLNSSALGRTVKRLKEELTEKTQQMVVLQEELQAKQVKIQELDEMVKDLNEGMETLTQKTQSQTNIITKQDRELNTAWFCYGTFKELKEQKILSGGGLFSKTTVLPTGFNKEYFITIDIRETTEIPLYDKKAKLRSNHPENSYEFVKDQQGNLTLNIKDIERFWSLSRYLVIEVG